MTSGKKVCIMSISSSKMVNCSCHAKIVITRESQAFGLFHTGGGDHVFGLGSNSHGPNCFPELVYHNLSLFFVFFSLFCIPILRHVSTTPSILSIRSPPFASNTPSLPIRHVTGGSYPGGEIQIEGNADHSRKGSKRHGDICHRKFFLHQDRLDIIKAKRAHKQYQDSQNNAY